MKSFFSLLSLQSYPQQIRTQAARFHELTLILRSIGFTTLEIQAIHAILAAVLHIGNIDFVTEMGATDLAAVLSDEVAPFFCFP